MNRKLIVSLFWVLCVSCAVFAQLPVDVHVRILKAEDARRYDAELEKLITGNSPEPVLVRAMLAAGRIGDERAVPALTQRLGSSSPKVAEMAAFALGEIESIAAADAILKALNAPGGIASLNERGPQHGVPSVGGPALQRRASSQATPPEGGTPNRGRLAEAAGKIAAANAKDPKAKQLSDAIAFVLAAEKEKQTSAETTRLALTAALRARPAGAEENVRFFLSHTDPNVIADALNTLARLRAKNANRDARDLLETHTHAVVRANAARVLGAAEDKEAFDLLVKAATSDVDPRVRVSAIRSLASLKDARAADKLLARGEELVAAMTKTRKPNFVPSEQSEFIEISNALGQLLAKTGNKRAIELFKEFAKGDLWRTPEPYVARVKVGGFSPGSGAGGEMPDMTEWKQYSTLAQVIGELANHEPESPEMKKVKEEAPQQIRKMAVAFINADAKAEPQAVLAAPDVLSSFARFKTDDLAEIARTALQNNDVQIRAAVAGILADIPASRENVDALQAAFRKDVLGDAKENDAQLAMLDALFKLDKAAALSAFKSALVSQDHLVRRKALDLLKNKEAWKDAPAAELATIQKMAQTPGMDRVWQYDPSSGTKMGQLLNADADYRRAIGRRNGSVRAVFTTSKGTFTIDLLPEDAPLTVDNFVKLASSGYFNGLEVHRVVPNFVMQDGDPRGDGNGGPGWSIRCEINMVPYDRGAVGMALSGKDTGGSQWFVTHSPQPHLDGGYTVFGRVNEKDMAVVDKIVRGDKIISVRVLETSTARKKPARR